MVEHAPHDHAQVRHTPPGNPRPEPERVLAFRHTFGQFLEVSIKQLERVCDRNRRCIRNWRRTGHECMSPSTFFDSILLKIYRRNRETGYTVTHGIPMSEISAAKPSAI